MTKSGLTVEVVGLDELEKLVERMEAAAQRMENIMQEFYLLYGTGEKQPIGILRSEAINSNAAKGDYEVLWYEEEMAGVLCKCKPGKNSDDITHTRAEWSACEDCGAEYRLNQFVERRSK